jgi:predicted methyltransferase
MRKLISALLLVVAGSFAVEANADSLREAVQDDGRTGEERARDRYRNPYDTLSFLGIQPGMTVVELYPGGGWYSAILAPYLADEGRLVAAHFNLEQENAPSYYESLHKAFTERFVESGRFGDIEVIAFDPPAKPSLGESGSADMVLTFRNIHSWIGAGQLEDVFAAAHEVLKPGGIFGVTGHRLPEDREQPPEADTGYVKESIVIDAAEKAGFRLEARSEVNANPLDDADHPNGVWTLPPNLDVPEGESEEEYLRIGESDRFTLKFVK